MDVRCEALQPQGILRTVLPDLDRRVDAFTVLSGPVDDDIRHAFHEYLTSLRPQLATAGQRGDVPAIARLAHALKGMGGGVGHPEISVLGQAMELSALAGQAARVQQLIEALDAWQTAELELRP